MEKRVVQIEKWTGGGKSTLIRVVAKSDFLPLSSAISVSLFLNLNSIQDSIVPFFTPYLFVLACWVMDTVPVQYSTTEPGK